MSSLRSFLIVNMFSQCLREFSRSGAVCLPLIYLNTANRCGGQ